MDYPDRTIWSRFTAAAGRSPDARAVIGTDTTLSYGELLTLAERLAAAITRHATEDDQLVAVLVNRSAAFPAVALAVLGTGRGYVPIDPKYPAERQRFLLQDSAVRLVLADAPAPWSTQTRHLGGGLYLCETEPPRDRPAVPADTAYVIYTSGSTGRPKGCIVGNHHVAALLDACGECFQLTSADVWSAFHSFSFDFSVWELFAPLTSGAAVVIVPGETALDPYHFAELLHSLRVSVLSQVPSAFANLTTALTNSRLSLPALRYVVLGGEALTENQYERWRASGAAPDAAVVNMYGITETTVHVTHHVMSERDLPFTRGSPIGKPLRHLRVRLETSDGAEATSGMPGEIVVSGASVSYGYLGRDDLTGSRFVHGCYRSGDWAIADNAGDLYYMGRRDDQVKLRGHRLELGEVEAVLRRVAGVREAVCTVVSRVGLDSLEAFVVWSGETEFPARALREAAKGQLPGYAVPARYHRLESLPLTANGKLDRNALREVAMS